LWLYSNYQDWVGLRNGELFDQQFIAHFFVDRAGYKAFVGAFLAGQTKLSPALQTYFATLWD
jgi:hypothetical protein